MVAFTGCGGDGVVRTVTVQDRQVVGRAEGFGYAEMKRQARKTCAIVPRDGLVESFRRVSGDRESYLGRPLTDNDVALMYAEDVRIKTRWRCSAPPTTAAWRA